MKLSLREIVTIIMASIDERQSIELYGIEEEGYIPQPVINKINKIDLKERAYFWEEVEAIANLLYEDKGSELNSLNNIHGEIEILAKERLKEYFE